MASFIDKLKSIGRGFLSSAGEGVSRAVASFAERYERHSSLVYEQRAHLPRGQYNRLAREHKAGERAFSLMMRGAGGIGWPASWTEDRARQALMFRRWVYVGVDRICSTAAGMPPLLARVRPKRQKRGGPKLKSGDIKRGPNRRHGRAQRRKLKAYYEARYRKSLQALKPHEEVEPVGDDHPLARLLKHPNAWDSSFGQLLYETILFLCLTGNAYWWVVPDKAFGRPLEIWCVPSQWMMGPKLGPAGEKYYQVMPYVGGAGSFTIPADEIIHFHFKNPLNKIDGWSPIQAIAPWIDVSESIDDSRYWAFKQGTQAQGALEFGPKYDPDDIDIDAIGAKFLGRYQGEHNAGRPFILPPDVKFNNISIAPKEMNFTESFEQIRDAILAALAVPKGIAGITDPGSDRALWGERAIFYEQAILPRLRYIGEVATAKLCSRWDDELRLYWEDPTPPDPQQVNADLGVDFQHFLRTPNEGRAIRGLEPIDDPLMDEVWLPPNMQPFSAVKKQIEQQQQQAQQAAQQQQMQAQPAQQAAQQPQSMQQQEQGQWGSMGGQNEAQDAALDVNDQAWTNQGAAVEKAHHYNRRFEASGHGWRLKYDGIDGRWKAMPSFPSFSSNGNGKHGHEKNGAAVLEAPARTVSTVNRLTVEGDRLIDLPDIRQEDDYSCGAASAMAVGRYFGVGPRALEEWKAALGTNVKTSTYPQAIVEHLSSLGLDVEARHNMTLDDLRQCWCQGKPVICCIQEYGVPSKQASYNYGHYVAVIGVGLGQVFVQDPSIDNVFARPGGTVPKNKEDVDADQTPGRMMIDEKKWLEVWHDEDADGNKYVRYGIAVGPPLPGHNRIARLLKSHAGGKSHLDRQGGQLPRIDPHMLQRADFITYGKDIKEGSNCSTCQFNRKIQGQHQCTFHDETKGIDLRGQPVNERNCCGQWDTPGTLRAWEKELDGVSVQKAWESSKHPRGENPKNPGQFSHTAGTRAEPFPSFPDAPFVREQRQEREKKPEQTRPFPPPEPVPGTEKPRRPLPADYAAAKNFSPSSWAEHSPVHKSLEQKKRMLTTDLSSGVNRAYLLRLADGTTGVFKPQSGESKKSIPSVPAQTGYRREVASSRVADILGLSDLVPATTFRTEPADGIGSIQAFLDKAKNATELERAERYDGLEDARRAAALDYLLCQLDRHQNNWMLKGGKLALIDNGRAFPTHYEKREFELSAAFHMEFLRHAVVENLDVPNLSQWRDKWGQIEKELRDCGIEDSAIKITRQRFDDLTRRTSRKFSDLPGFLDGYTLGKLFQEHGKRPAGYESR